MPVRRKKREAAAPEAPARGRSTFLIALGAFFGGAIVMWLIGQLSSAPVPQRTGLPTPARFAQAERPPDVAGRSPAEAATLLGNWHYDRQRWPDAIAHYQQALSLGADNPDIRTDLGNCYRFSGHPEKALEQYAIAQRQNPMHENSLFNTGGLYGEVLRDDAKAAATWREFIQRFPNTPAAQRARKFLADIEAKQTADAAALQKVFSEDKPPAAPK